MRHDIKELIDEIEQQNVRDKITAIWQQWGNWILALLGALIVGSGGWGIYQHAQHQQHVKFAELFEQGRDALANKQEEQGKKILEDVAKRGIPAYRAMAYLALADFYMKLKRTEPAYKQFKALEQDKVVLPFYRGLGALNRMRIDYENKKDARVLLSELDALMSQNPSIQFMGLEFKGFLLMQIKEYQKAREVFVQIAQSPQTDPQTRKRIHAINRLMSITHAQ